MFVSSVQMRRLAQTPFVRSKMFSQQSQLNQSLKSTSQHIKCFSSLSSSQSSNQDKKGYSLFFKSLIMSGAIATALTLTNSSLNISECATSSKSNKNEKQLPTFTLDEVSKHDGKGKDKTSWVTYGNGVYDITNFIESHPGGASKIKLAAGKSVEPFWALFPFHQVTKYNYYCCCYY